MSTINDFDIYECFGIEENKDGVAIIFEKNGWLIKVPNPKKNLKLTEDQKMVAILKGSYSKG